MQARTAQAGSVLRRSGRSAARCAVCHEDPSRAVPCPRCGGTTCLPCALGEPACACCGESLEAALPHLTRDAHPVERGVLARLRALLCLTRREAHELSSRWSSDTGQQMSYPVSLFLLSLLASLPVWLVLAVWLKHTLR